MDIMYSNCTVCMIWAAALFICPCWANALIGQTHIHFHGQNHCFCSSWAQSGFGAIWWIFLGCGTLAEIHCGSSYKVCLQVESFFFFFPRQNLQYKQFPVWMQNYCSYFEKAGTSVCMIALLKKQISQIKKQFQSNRKYWYNLFNTLPLNPQGLELKVIDIMLAPCIPDTL